MTTELTWRHRATVEGIPASPINTPSPPAGAGEPLSDEALPIPTMMARKAASGDADAFKGRILALRTTDTPTLIIRLATTDDAAMLWAIHLTLDGRGVAPCLRWPMNGSSPQAEFVTFAADLHWFAKRNPDHRPIYRGWQRALAHPPASPPWHAAVHRQYLFAARRNSLAYLCAKGLALTDRQRQELLTLPTNAMQAERRQLQPDRFAELRERLLTHAMANPDLSGARQPHDTANRRAALWRVFVLSGRCKTATARNWFMLTNETSTATGKPKPVTRQALDKQLAIVEDVLRGAP